MSSSAKIKVIPSLLAYAREAIGFSVDEAAKKLNVDSSYILSCEKEEAEYAIPEIKHFAKIYKRPLSFFFLPSPPTEKPIPADFRTLDSAKIDDLPQKVRLAIRRAQINRKMMREYLDDYSVGLNAKIDISASPSVHAKSIREFLGVSIEEQLSYAGKSGEKSALSRWISSIEEKGVSVFQMDLDKEFRGFCLRENELPPVIVINSREAKSGKIFTLIHEFCHLMIPQSKINSLLNSKGEELTHKIIEAYANEFAGSLLVPKDSIESERYFILYTQTKNDEYIQKLAKKFSVSQSVILRRFLSYGLINQREYEDKEKILRDQFLQYKIKEKARMKSGGFAARDIPKETIQKVGFRLGQRAFEAVADGKMSTYELVQFFDVKTKHLNKMRTLLGSQYSSIV